MHCPLAKTWRDDCCDLTLFVNVLGDRQIDDIHPKEIDAFVQHQIDCKYKPSMVNRRLAAGVSLYSYVASEGRSLPYPVLPKRYSLYEPHQQPRPPPVITVPKGPNVSVCPGLTKLSLHQYPRPKPTYAEACAQILYSVLARAHLLLNSPY
jgi:hypothetical protein